ncbi:exopolysaccharide biosynthesis polyprenyl glycosylphosphotransferase [Candidatus Peregrinibacteria bacterium]|nr:exopolysaccharide biosynthesis polyprenyl glycosylphosphotransferase [Candidatus Peregrinibacteria bacterium]
MKRFEIFFGIIKVPVDFIMVILAFLAAYELRLVTEPIKGIAKPIDYSVLPTIKEYLNFSIGAAVALIVIFVLGRMYTLKTTLRFSGETKKVIIFGGIWAMAIITYFFFTRTFPFSRLAIIYSFALTIIFTTFGRGLIRIIQRGFLRMGVGRRRLLFIGNNNITKEIYKYLSNDLRYKIVGLIGQKKKDKLKILGAVRDLEKIIERNKIDEIIQTKSDVSETQAEDILELCDLHHVNYRFIPDLIDVHRTNISIQTIGSIPIISLKPTPLDGWGKVAKRITDILGASLGLIILSPIFLITAIAIKIDSKGPIFFARLDEGSPVKRVGQYGKLFNFYKFRSMHPKTDNLRYTELTKKNIRKDGPLVKIKNDPRITRVGGFIRKYSIDELPQLWNVLKGNMSLVGPRPHLPEEVAKYKRHHRFILNIKPGLTGLSQISGRSDLSFEEEVKLDRYYIENWSILLDIKIIFKTLGVILKDYKE